MKALLCTRAGTSDDLTLGDSGQTQCPPRAGIAAVGKSRAGRVPTLGEGDFHTCAGFVADKTMLPGGLTPQDPDP